MQTPSPGSFANQLNAIDVVSSNDVWAVGVYSNSSGTVATLTEHWDGTTWSVVPSPAPSLTDLTAVTTIASDDVWAVGSGPNGGFSIHWDGATWTTVAMPLVGVEDYLHGLAHTSSSDVWAVGEASPNFESWQALALHWNGVRWTPVKAPSGPQEAHFYGVTDFTPSDAWAVGTDGALPLILHWDGAAWSAVPTPSPAAGQLLDIGASGASNLWSVGWYEASGSTQQTLVEQAPSTSQGQVVGQTNVSGALISWFGHQSGTTETDILGKYAAAGLLAGTYTFVASAQGCNPASAQVTVTAGQTTVQNFKLVC